jgi:hypothetical protein
VRKDFIAEEIIATQTKETNVYRLIMKAGAEIFAPPASWAL